tara:strand:+ start:507 stop:638 length:132 start_codon:yes stop_codon:yes gene_type:complete
MDEEKKPKVRINKDVLADVIKKYKKIKKYQKSNLFEIKKLDHE